MLVEILKKYIVARLTTTARDKPGIISWVISHHYMYNIINIHGYKCSCTGNNPISWPE